MTESDEQRETAGGQEGQGDGHKRRNAGVKVQNASHNKKKRQSGARLTGVGVCCVADDESMCFCIALETSNKWLGEEVRCQKARLQ